MNTHGSSGNWRPTQSVATASKRSSMLMTARKFFEERNILEVDTPVLTSIAVSDPSVNCIPAGKDSHRRFLRSSPEFFLKRMLAAGFPDIVEIGHVFRDGEVGRNHQPEFTMIEWYRRGFGLQQIIDETTQLLHSLIDGEKLASAPLLVDYRCAFEAVLGVDPLIAEIETLAHSAGADERLRESLGDNRDQWLDLLLSDRIAVDFPTDRLTVLTHYPASQAALARICPDDPVVADRFEVFLGCLELANGYVELTDAEEQRARFVFDHEQRSDRDLPVPQLDEEFLDAISAGLPECAGVSIGFERILMINENADDIASVCCFPARDIKNDG